MMSIFDFRAIFAIVVLLLVVSSCQQDAGPLDIEEVRSVISDLPESVSFPTDNLYSDAKHELGQRLFWDPILSGQKDVSCATCHHPNLGYADNRDLSSGVNGVGLGSNRTNGDVIRRNAPTILNVAYNGIDVNGNYSPLNAPMFWDNRTKSLEQQALLPILSHDEMRGTDISENAILDTVIQRIASIDEYRDLFRNAYGTDVITENNIAEALATFQRGIIANNSPFDQYIRGNSSALTDQQIEGMNTFIDVGCANCHSGPMFSDYKLHILSTPNHPGVVDQGATGNFEFRTPTLRNLNLTAPYMHNGVFDDLRDVLEFYVDIRRGNGNSQNPNVSDNQIDQDARELSLNNGDIIEIISFLNSLNDNGFDRSIPQSVPSGLPVGGNIN